MEIIATNALISINATFWVQLGSFLIFLYVMNRIMFRPLLNTISQRKEHIAEFKQKIQAGKEDLDRLSRDLESERATILREANKVLLSLEAEGEQQASEMVTDVTQQIAQLRNETERRVKDQVRQVRQELTGEVDALTMTIMEKVLQRRLPS